MNQITVFDFRVYLFARQAFMLFHLDRVVEVARRGAYFVSTFARKLRENQVRTRNPPALPVGWLILTLSRRPRSGRTLSSRGPIRRASISLRRAKQRSLPNRIRRPRSRS